MKSTYSKLDIGMMYDCLTVGNWDCSLRTFSYVAVESSFKKK